MKISVVIPVYNEEKYLPACLKSLFDQVEKPKEVIIVDNNSTDQTVALAKKFPVKIVTEKKQGITWARNRGFNEAQGDIIARCDADCLLPKDWIKRIADQFSQKNIDGLTGPVKFYDLPLQSKLISEIYLKNLYWLQGRKNILIGPNMAISQKIWQKIKDEVCTNDQEVHEDIDLAIHINKNHGKIFVDDQLVVLISARRIIHKPQSFFLEYPFRFLKTYLKHYPLPFGD
jgi:glycosyltransferase involved in cell wall biosynthesis